MQVRKLAKLSSFYARRAWTYKASAASEILGMFFTVGLLIYFWSLVGDTGVVDSSGERLAYFLVADSVNRLAIGRNFGYMSQLSKDVRTGAITNLLLMPFSAFQHVFIKVLGRMVSQNVMSVTAIIGALAWQMDGGLQIVQGLILAVVMISIGYYFSMLLSTLAFVLTEVHGLRMSVGFIIKVIGGLFVPLALMPDSARIILELLPTSYLGYWLPAYISGIEFNYLRVLATGLSWVVILRFVARWAFDRMLEKAEAVGL